MASDQLNKLLDKMDEGPPFLREHVGEIKRLDEQVESIMKEIKDKTLACLKNYRKLTPAQKMKAYNELKAKYYKAESLSEEKVAIAQKIYDRVDDDIRMVDDHIANFTNAQKMRSEAEEKKANESPVNRKRKAIAKKGDKRKKGSEAKEARLAETGSAMESMKIASLQPRIDMPENPAEPKYCTCNSVSYGDMVACDNKDCPYEWFHFACVGISAAPDGVWFCRSCKESNKKKKK